MGKKYTLSFIFPVLSGVMGGAQMLFINSIVQLVKWDICYIRLYDYKQGVIRTYLEKNNIEGYEFISLDENEFYIRNRGDEIFIMTNSGVLIYPQLMEKNNNTTILVWDVFYPFWKYFYKVNFFSIPQLKHKIFSLLHGKKAVLFMEHKGMEAFENLGFYFEDKRIACVPVTNIEDLYDTNRYNNVIHIGYIARCIDWKIKPIEHLLNCLGKSDHRYKLSIVTNDIKNFSKHLLPPGNVEIHFKENLYGDQLKSFVSTLNIGIGMGTSALEMAKHGIPTILIDFSSNPFPSDYKFRWLFENEPGNLGFDLNESTYYTKGHSWNELIFNFNNNRKEYGELSIDYIRTYHTIEKTTKSLFEYSIKSQLIPEDLKGVSFKIYHLRRKLNRIRNMKRFLEV